MACLRASWSRIERSANDGHRAIGEAVIILTSSLRQFRLDKIEVCCGLQKLVRPMMLQGCCKADRAEVVERDRFATPNSLKSHGERNLLSPFSNSCAITPKLCMPSRPVHPSKKLPGTQITYRSKISIAPAALPLHTSRDFVPWHFLDAGRRSAWIASSCRHPKTCTIRDIARLV